jgi:hypothetical protein
LTHDEEQYRRDKQETKTRNWTLRRQVNQAQGQSDQCRQPGRENEGFVSPK